MKECMIMAKRSDKKIKLLERHEKLTPEVKNRLERSRPVGVSPLA